MNSFLQILAQSPHDWTTRLVYADWLDEQGRIEEGFLQRWMGRNEKHPLFRPAELVRKRWGWYPIMPPFRGSGNECLPLPVFYGLSGIRTIHRNKLYLTLGDALEDLSLSLDNLRWILRVNP